MADHDVWMGVEQGADQTVAAARIADEQTERPDVTKIGRLASRFPGPLEPAREEIAGEFAGINDAVPKLFESDHRIVATRFRDRRLAVAVFAGGFFSRRSPAVG
jgi:hypothetical protein